MTKNHVILAVAAFALLSIAPLGNVARALVTSITIDKLAAAPAIIDKTFTHHGDMDVNPMNPGDMRNFAATFSMEDLHFDIPKGQIDINDLVIVQDLFQNVTISRMVGTGSHDFIWLKGDFLAPPTWFKVTTDVSIDKITATPEPATMTLFGLGTAVLLGAGALRRRKAQASA